MFVRPSVAKFHKNAIFSKKLSNLEPLSLSTTYRMSYIGFSKKEFWDTKKSRWRRSAILKIMKSPYLNEKSSDFDLELDDQI